MAKKLKDVIHLHFGCPCMRGIYVPGQETRFEESRIDTRMLYEYINGLAECKPLLRRLDSMTEEGFKELVYLKFGSNNRDIITQSISRIERTPKQMKYATTFGTSIPYSCYDKDNKHILTATFSTESMNPEQVLHLLKLGVDIFGLIDAGLAIDINQ